MPMSIARSSPPKGEEYTINYKAQLAGSDWKVYDVVAENISLVNNYRSQFNRVISKSSYEELVRRLRDKSEFDRRADKIAPTPPREFSR